MNKLEYLNALEQELRGKLPTGEVDDILRDYAEYFNDGAQQGIPEEQTAYRLGTPSEVARQIVAENCPPDRGFTAYYSRMRAKIKRENDNTKWIWIIIAIVTFPVWIGAVAAVGGVLFAVAVAMVALAGSLLVCGIIMIGLIFVWIGEITVLATIYLAVGGVGLVALGICVSCLIVMAVRGLVRFIKGRLGRGKQTPEEVNTNA